MKKNLFLSMFAIASMLFATSCSQNEVLDEPTTVGFVDATFKIGTADGIGSRAVIGDGTKVDKVVCAIFDANGDEMTDLRKTENVSNKQATYNVRLAKGQAYRAVFFAYNSTADAYDVTNLKSIKIKGNQSSNIEERDAFTVYEEIKATETMNAINKNITLKRPFAQLNLGIDGTELEDARKAGVIVTETYIKVSNVYDEFSAYDNAVVSTDAAETMEFSMNAIPTETLKVDANNNDVFDNDENYTYLALNYLLVGDAGSEKTLTDVEFIWKTADGKTNSPSTKFINIPVERNHRTNIIGKLLTNPAQFNITIDENFENSPADDKLVNEDGTIYKTVSTLQELQTALDNVINNSKNIITLAAEISGDAKVTEKQGATIEIDGCENTYKGTFKINGGTNDQGATTIFKNIKFETDQSITFIYADDSQGNERYPDNIIVDNCEFKATGNATNNAVGLKVRSLRDKLIITNTTAEGMHTLLQTNSCNEVAKEILVDNVTITNGKNGLSFRQSDVVTVSNTTITATGYGIRADGYTNYGIKIKDCNINAEYPVAITNMTGTNYSIEFEGNNILTTENAYQIIITNNKNEDQFDVPTGTYTLTGANGFNVYPMEEGTPMNASSSAQLSNVIAAGATTVNLTAGEFNTDFYNIDDKETLTIIGTEGTKIAFSNLQVRASQFKEVKIQNCEILRMPNKTWGHLVFGSSDDATGVYTIENCIFNGQGTQGIYINENVSGVTYNILNCTFNGDFGSEGAVTIQCNENVNHNVNVKGCTFINIPASSNKIFVIYQNTDTTVWNLDTDVPSAEINSVVRNW